MTILVERRFRCASSREQLWPVITDTERMNRAVGLGAITLEKTGGENAARYLVKTVSGGFPIEYEERPFEWIEHERFSVRRVMRKGVLRVLENRFALASLPDGATEVHIAILAEPRIGLLAPVVRLTVARFVARLEREISAVDRELGKHASATFALHEPQIEDGAFERFSRALRESLSDEQRAVGERLIGLVRDGSDVEVDRMRPFELADDWELDRDQVLRACLHGVGSGLLELRWDIVCPSCRTASESLPSLAELGAAGHCQSCDVDFGLDLDRAVEATFRPSRALRTIDVGPYCIGGPARTPHVVVQRIVEPSGQVELPAPSAPARYRVFARGGAKTALSVEEGAPTSLRLSLRGDQLSPPRASIAPGGIVLLEQVDGPERHVKLERLEHADRAATAHRVSLLPEFRRMFASEVLKPGISLEVARVALLFSDLTNSTALYSEVGDAKAFGVVQEHFRLLERIVGDAGGSIVKTIGDAVMAAFPEESAAIRCAVAMHRAFPEFRERTRDARANRLKIGVYAGPCYAVTANQNLDYFGQTVNIAARLQSAAEAGEIILTAQSAEEAVRNGWLGGARPSEHFEAKLKGLPTPVLVARVPIDA